MKKLVLSLVAVLGIGLLTNKSFAQTTTATTATTATTDIVGTLSGDADYNVFSILIRAANVEPAVKGAGPFTIFVPSNNAFANLSSDKLDALVKDPNLAAIVKNHIVTGTYDKAGILKALAATGTATLTTLDGKKLTLTVADKHLQITDEQGNKANVIKFDMLGSNGVAIGLSAVLSK